MPYAPQRLPQMAFGAGPPQKPWTQTLMDSWAAKGAVNAVSWLGESLNRLNVAKNALLLGDIATMGKSLVPLYETLGFGDVKEITGEDVLREWGIPAGQKWDIPLISRLIGKKTSREIFGFLALDVLGDPLMWLGGPGLTKAGVAAKKAQMALFAQGEVAKGLLAFPASWSAQAAKGYRAALRFGVTAKGAVPIIRGKRALEYLESGIQFAKFAKAGRPRAWAKAFNVADSPVIRALKRHADISTLPDVEKLNEVARAFDAKDALLSPAMRSQVAEATEAYGRFQRGATIGTPFSRYPREVQEAAEKFAAVVDAEGVLAKKTGLRSGDMGDWIGEMARDWEGAVTAKEKIQEKGIEKLGAPRDRVIRALEKTISDLQVTADEFPAGAPADEVIERIRGLMDVRDSIAEAARATGTTAERMQALNKLWEVAPGRKFDTQTFARILRGLGVEVPETWRGEGGTLALLTKYMSDAAGTPEESLAAARAWFEKLKLAEGNLPGYVPRAPTRAGRAGLEHAKALIGDPLTDMPDDFILRSRSQYEAFVDPAIGDRMAAKRARHWLMGKEATPEGQQFVRQMARAYIDKDTGQYLSLEDIKRAAESAEATVKGGTLGRQEAIALGARERYGFLERWADQIVTGKTRTIPALYEVEAAPGRALARMMDKTVEAVKSKKFIEAIKDAGEDFVSKTRREVTWIKGERISANLKGLWVDPHLAVAAKDLTNKLANPQSLGRIAGFAADTIAFWKRITLGPFLAYQTRNIVTDVLNDFFVTGNADLTTFSRAWKVLHDPTATITGKMRSAKAKDLLRTMAAADLGTSFVEGEVLTRFRTSWPRAIEKLGGQIPPSLKALNPLSESFLITRFGRQREKVHRIASFIHQYLDEGVDAVTSASKVKMAFFDYGPKGFSKWEQKWARSVFPFYSFLRKNTALQGHLLFTKPYYIGAQLKAIPSERTEDEKEEMKLLPPAVREGLVFRAGRDKNTVTYIKGLGLPIEDVAELLTMGTGPGRIAERILARTSPLIKMPLEWLNDRNFYFGTKITDYQRGYSWMKVLPKSWQKFLGFKEIKRKGRPLKWRMDPWKLWALSQIRFFSTLGKLTNADRPGWERFAWGATGIRPMRFDIEHMKMRAERREMDRLTEELRRRGEIGIFPVPYARAGIEPSPEAKALLEAFREQQRARRRGRPSGF